MQWQIGKKPRSAGDKLNWRFKLLFENIGIIDENFEFVPNQYVLVEEETGTIAYIGSEAPSADVLAGVSSEAPSADMLAGVSGEAPSAEVKASSQRTYNGVGKLMLPAMYNAHAHAPMTLLRGYAENAPLDTWLNKMVWPYEDKMTLEDNYWACNLALAEMARFGCVGFSDMYYATRQRARAATEAHMKANLCTSPIAFEPKDISEFPNYEDMQYAMANLHESASGRIRFEACVHAEYTSNNITAKSTIDWARQVGAGLHIHLSETHAEVESCKARHGGATPVEWFDSLGAFSVPTTAAHCVWVSDADIEILATRGVSVAYNPASNMKLASGFAPVARMLEAGINVCLGTDGMASNNNHNMYQDMYLMALLSKGFCANPTLITPAEALRAATRAGALAQGRPDCGLIKAGFKADLAVLDISGPAWAPAHDMLCNVVYAASGSDVVLTMCDGAIVYEDGVWPTIDVERARAEVCARHARICAELEAGA